MRLTSRDVLEAVATTAIATEPGEELDWECVAKLLNERLDEANQGQPPEFAGKHQRQPAPAA